MAILTIVGRALAAFLGTMLMITLAGILFLGYRIYGAPPQSDNERHLQAKHAYLETLAAAPSKPGTPPNLIFILYDDMGYGDIGAGAVGNLIATPNIDQLAADGVTLSDFHSPSPVCTPSRAGFLTGRLAPRAGLPNVVHPTGSPAANIFGRLLSPGTNTRLPAEEITLADILKSVGYRTGMVGKWHLGDRSPSLPNDMGFDSYYGPLYSNDMKPFAFYRNTDIAAAAPVDQTRMSEIYTREAAEFIRTNSDERFFLYFAHSFPHDPLSTRNSRAGTSDAGLYGDVLEEIDEGVGQIVETLRAEGILDNTLIIISSDNGPWFLGSPGHNRGRKGNTFEGGMRVPFIAHWPKSIAPGRVEGAMAMGTDLLPTLLDILDLPLPGDRILDGKSILQVLTYGAPTPHKVLHYYDSETLFATRTQQFKYRAPIGVLYSQDAMPMGVRMPVKEWLFDLRGDPLEAYDTATRHPDVLAELRAAFAEKQEEMTTNPRGWLE